MNRQERRNLNNIKLSPAEVSKLINKAKAEAMDFAIQKYCVVTSIILHDKLGFDTQQIQKVLDDISNTCECVDVGTVSFTDLERIVRDELELNIV